MGDPAPADRAAHYRQMAQAARELGESTLDPEIRASYLDLAARWRKLAERAEHEPRTFRPVIDPTP